MSDDTVPEVLADPIGVTVDLVAGIEAGMDRRLVEAGGN